MIRGTDGIGDMKTCTRCGKTKNLQAFAWKNRRQGTRSTGCKACQTILNKSHYKRNKKMYFDKNRKRRLKMRCLMNKLKESTPCQDCGGFFIALVMEFDHIKGKKRFNISSKLEGSKTKLKIEMAKCELVCANCHRVRTHKRKNL